MSLFDQQTIPLPLTDTQSSQLQFWPNWLDVATANDLLQQSIQQLPWRADTITIAGKSILVPRLHCWYGEPRSRYQWSGLTMQAVAFPPWLDALRQQVEQAARCSFNRCLANYYRDGNDSVDWHADDETILGKAPIIASVSLGAERVFQLRHRVTKQRFDLSLPHGSLLVMGAGMQQYWHHKIPKVKSPCEPRINFTFRYIV